MSTEKKPAPGFRWLEEGKEDPFARYCDRPFDELPMADWTSDELANYGFMQYNRSMDEEAAILVGQLDGSTDHVPKIAFMTAIQQRMRWLSRQLAMANGTYPGYEKPKPNIHAMPSLINEDPVSRTKIVNAEWVKWQIKNFGLSEEDAEMMGAMLYVSMLEVQGAPMEPIIHQAKRDSLTYSYTEGLTDLSERVLECRSAAVLVKQEEPDIKTPAEWFEEVNKLATKLGLNSMILNNEQFISRIERLIILAPSGKRILTHAPWLTRRAIGLDASSFTARKEAFNTVIALVDEGIAVSQQQVRDLFGDDTPETIDSNQRKFIPTGGSNGDKDDGDGRS